MEYLCIIYELSKVLANVLLIVVLIFLVFALRRLLK